MQGISTDFPVDSVPCTALLLSRKLWYTTIGHKLGIWTAPKPRDSTIANGFILLILHPFAIVESRELSRGSKSKFVPDCGINALIVGAGPTGLTLGCELIKRGLSVRLIEQLPKQTDQSRALALHSRTLEVFEKMGILKEFLNQGIIVRQGNIYFSRKRVGIIDFSYLIAPYPFILVVPQSQTEKILTEHFVKLGGKVERNVTLKEISGAKAHLLHAGQKEEILSPTWIFGCDGAHSAVRHSLNLPFKGAKFSETFALADVEVSTSLPHDQAHMFLAPDSDAALFPLPENHCYRLIILVQNKDVDLPSGLDLPFFQSHIDRLSPVPVEIKKVNWMSLFSIHRRITPKMRVGNTFLLGDACHIHSPFGGQGLNTSVQDAFNLAWKIALVE